jgi:hypothetical protein
MERRVATSELLIGIEALALLRHLYAGIDDQVGSRM